MNSLVSAGPRLLLVLLAWLPALPVHAQATDAVRQFEEGNRRYAAGDYRAALDAYEAAAASGYVSGALFYNMGNAYYRLDEVGQAIRHYERARRLMPDDPELLHNLEMARERTVDDFAQLPEPFWRPWWRGVVSVTGVGGLFAAGLLFYLAAMGLLAYRVWTRDRTPWLRRTLSVSALVGVLLLTAAFGTSADRALHRSAVVVADQTTLRETPRAGAPGVVDVHEGVLIDVLRTDDRWIEARLPNGVTGWMDSDAAAPIEGGD